MKKIFILLIPLLLGLYLFLPLRKDNPQDTQDKIQIHASALSRPSKKTTQIAEKTTTEIKPVNEKEVEEVLSATNLWEDLNSIDGLMQDRLDKARELLPPEAYEKLEKVIEENFSGSKFSEEVKAYLGQNLTREDVLELKALTEDPFLKKVWDMQGKSNPTDTEIAEFSKDFSPTQERLKLMNEYEEQGGASDKMLDLNQEFLKGMMEGASDKKISQKDLDLIAEKIRPALKQEVLTRLFYTYADLSDQELKTLKEYDKNPVLNKVENLVHSKLKNLLFKGGMEVGKLHKGRKI